MGKRLSILLATLALVVGLILPGEPLAAKKVSIFINNSELYIQDSPILQNGRTYVPLRGVFEALEASVNWNSATKEVQVKRHDRNVTVRIGSQSAMINGATRALDARPFINSSRTYVPFRFISEAIGAKVEWDSANYAVRITMEGVETKPQPKPVDEKPIAIKSFLGQSESKLQLELGQAKQKTNTEYGFQWNSFHNNYQNYALAGVQNGEVVAFYTNSNGYLQKYGLSTSSTKNNVRQKFGQSISSIQKGNTIYEYKDNEGGWEMFNYEGGYLTVFYDVHKSMTVTSIFHITKELESKKAGYYGTTNNQTRDSFEQNLFEITNALRVREGLHALEWDTLAAASARKHSEDMARNNFFAHTNLNGLDPFDRMERDGISYSYAGENLALGQFNAIFAHEGLMNSIGHRKNILNKGFTRLGTGVAYGSDKRPYFTQKYYTP